jgi:photosystem II stability/assembly factor-like uncharacterized protein
VIYTGTVSNGLFLSTNGTATWNPASFAGGQIRATATDPLAPGTVYAGATGVWKSTDWGAHWHSVNNGIPPGVAGACCLQIASLAVSPSVPGLIFAGARFGGVFKSVDGGATWTSASNGLPALFSARSLALAATSPFTIYAGGSRVDTNSGGVYASKDGGTSWSAAGLTDINLEISALASDPSAPATIYASSDGGDGLTAGVWKSTDAGTSWRQIMSQQILGQAGTPAVIAMALDTRHPGTLYAGNYGDRIFKTTDGGETWSSLNTDDGATGRVMALAIDPTASNLIYAGSANGVYRSGDAGATWMPVSTGLSASDILTLGPDAAHPGGVYAGGIGTGILYSSDAGQSWSALVPPYKYGGGNFVTSLAVDPADSAIVYVTNALHLEGGLLKTRDHGATWQDSDAGLRPGDIQTVAISPSASSSLYCSDFSGNVYRSTDSGATWALASGGLPAYGLKSLLASASSSLTAFVGTNGHGVFKTSDGGQTWQSAGLAAYDIYALAEGPHGRPLYALSPFSALGGLARSDDGGASWQVLASSVTGDALAIDPLDPAKLYAGGIGGVWKSVDGGLTWSPLSQGLNFNVTSLLIDPNQHTRLWAGTSTGFYSGGGVFERSSSRRSLLTRAATRPCRWGPPPPSPVAAVPSPALRRSPGACLPGLLARWRRYPLPVRCRPPSCSTAKGSTPPAWSYPAPASAPVPR